MKDNTQQIRIFNGTYISSDHDRPYGKIYSEPAHRRTGCRAVGCSVRRGAGRGAAERAGIGRTGAERSSHTEDQQVGGAAHDNI